MTTAAQDLRKLAHDIELVTRESSVASIANEQVRALTDYLTLLARVMEMQTCSQKERPPERQAAKFPEQHV